MINITAVEGCSATLPWSYDPLLGEPLGLAVIKTGVPPTTLLTKVGGEEAEPREARFVFLENAGIIIHDVMIEDGGVYELRVVFNNLSIYQQAELHVTGW